jgi:FAD/FMN-containing dehydrogenase
LPGDEEGCVKAKETVMDLAKKAVELGGSLSGEHGIGKLKRHFIPLMFSEYAINSMKNIKLSLDPKELLGKGILF